MAPSLSWRRPIERAAAAAASAAPKFGAAAAALRAKKRALFLDAPREERVAPLTGGGGAAEQVICSNCGGRAKRVILNLALKRSLVVVCRSLAARNARRSNATSANSPSGPLQLTNCRSGSIRPRAASLIHGRKSQAAVAEVEERRIARVARRCADAAAAAAGG